MILSYHYRLKGYFLLFIFYLRGEVDFQKLADPEYFNAFNELLDSGYISLELTFNI